METDTCCRLKQVEIDAAETRIAKLEAQVRQGIETIEGLLSECDCPHSRVIQAESVVAAMRASLRHYASRSER